MTNRHYYCILLWSLLPLGIASAQSVSLGADFVSRYVWRGFDFGQSFSVQPSFSVSGGNIEIGSWASYSIAADGAEANEHDLWVGYSLETESAGSFGFGITDYYFPGLGEIDFFNFEGDGAGSHWIEPYVSYSAPESFPITLYAAFMAHNDPDRSIYLEGSLPFEIGGTAMGLTIGMVPGESAFYAVASASVINMGVSAETELKITDQFSHLEPHARGVIPGVRLQHQSLTRPIGRRAVRWSRLTKTAQKTVYIN